MRALLVGAVLTACLGFHVLGGIVGLNLAVAWVVEISTDPRPD